MRSTHRRVDHRQPRGCRAFSIESLENRQLLSLTIPGYATPDYVAYVAPHSVAPLSTAGPTGYTPAQIRQAYGIDKITFNNGTVAGDGSGTTIAIVDAYDDPKIANDLHQFDLQFGLPDPVFTKVNETGEHHGAAGGQRGLGHRNRARRGMGSRHRPEGQHPAGRGQ